MTETPAHHPWSKYYADRGLSRPPVAELARRARRPAAGNTADNRSAQNDGKVTEVSAELAAAVAAVTARANSSSTAPFLSPQQKELAAREAKRLARWRVARMALAAAAVLVSLHFAVTHFICRAPSEAALAAHILSLPDATLPLFSSARQPLQADGVAITQADQIDGSHYRYVATVTLRLRKPLYVPAMTNGTANYRRLQDALQRALAQDLRLKSLDAAETPEAPSLPQLLQRTHQAGETILVRVPFIARRFGWQWRLEQPQLGLSLANRDLVGDSVDRYAGSPYLIFGGPSTLAEIRRRTQLATNYVIAVAKEVQRRADGEAVADTNAGGLANRIAISGLADLPAQAATDAAIADQPALPADATEVAHAEAKPAIDPNAPAVLLEPSAKYFSASRAGGQ